MTGAGRILQIGYGAFGRTHARAWQALGRAAELIVADPDLAAHARLAADLPQARAVADYSEALGQCCAVDILTPTDTHCRIALEALKAGRPVFVEKPVVISLAEARALRDAACQARQPVMGGNYFRFHPKSIELRATIQAGDLGELRLLTGRFAGYKRARSDSGVLQNDAVHFTDLFCWLVGRLPDAVHALTRDHFGRGMADTALLALEWRNGPLAQIECGYVQPGRWPDAVVPGALTSKEIAASGSKGAVEIDFAAETYVCHKVIHEQIEGIWTPRFVAPAASRNVPAADAEAVLTAELFDFLRRIVGDASPTTVYEGDGLDGALNMARLIEALEISARERRVVELHERESDGN